MSKGFLFGLPHEPLAPGLGAPEISNGERRIGLAIPDVYKAFLSQMNGARLDGVVHFTTPAVTKKSSTNEQAVFEVRWLAGILPPGSGASPQDLAGWHERFAKSARTVRVSAKRTKSQPRVPAGAFRFASSPRGEFIVFADGALREEVHFIDRDYGERMLVARSLEEFFAGLRARDASEVIAAFPMEPIVHASATKPKTKNVERPTSGSAEKSKKVYEGVVFGPHGRRRPKGPLHVRDARVVDCEFVSCAPAPDFSTFERIEVVRAVTTITLVTCTIFRQVRVDSMKLRPPKKFDALRLINCLFDRVTLVGDFRGRIVISTEIRGLLPREKKRITSHYDDVEWALDVRNARFQSLSLRDVPAHLVRRDPERQVLLRTDRLAADSSWRKRIPKAVGSLQFAIDRPDRWHFFSADELSSKFEERLEILTRLKDAGLAE